MAFSRLCDPGSGTSRGAEELAAGSPGATLDHRAAVDEAAVGDRGRGARRSAGGRATRRRRDLAGRRR